jgi:molybdenum cofactor cytidylyltransferase
VSEPPADPARLGAVVLAAGGSSRLGRPKQLVRLNGLPMVRRAAALAAGLCPGRVIVVTGACHGRVAAALRGCDVTIARNRRWRLGLASSLSKGLAALPADAAGALVLSCDQPLVGAAELRRLIDAWRRRPDRPAAAAYAGTVGVPAVLTPRLCFAARALEGDTGAAALLRATKGLSRVPMAAAVEDLDEPADLIRFGQISPNFSS